MLERMRDTDRKLGDDAHMAGMTQVKNRIYALHHPHLQALMSLQNLGTTIGLIDLKTGSTTRINNAHNPNLSVGHIAN